MSATTTFLLSRNDDDVVVLMLASRLTFAGGLMLAAVFILAECSTTISSKYSAVLCPTTTAIAPLLAGVFRCVLS